jgi:predicted MarR family transcription regulator
MFTIEHEFDATVITLVDEGQSPLHEDVTVSAFAEEVVLEQWDPRTDRVARITLSPEQLRDLAAALNLPEGIYRTAP